MAVVVNNPERSYRGDSGYGFLLGVILLLLFAVLFFVYGLPYLGTIGRTQINVPDKINVNVQQQPGK